MVQRGTSASQLNLNTMVFGTTGWRPNANSPSPNTQRVPLSPRPLFDVGAVSHGIRGRLYSRKSRAFPENREYQSSRTQTSAPLAEVGASSSPEKAGSFPIVTSIQAQRAIRNCAESRSAKEKRPRRATSIAPRPDIPMTMRSPDSAPARLTMAALAVPLVTTAFAPDPSGVERRNQRASSSHGSIRRRGKVGWTEDRPE